MNGEILNKVSAAIAENRLDSHWDVRVEDMCSLRWPEDGRSDQRQKAEACRRDKVDHYVLSARHGDLIVQGWAEYDHGSKKVLNKNFTPTAVYYQTTIGRENLAVIDRPPRVDAGENTGLGQPNGIFDEHDLLFERPMRVGSGLIDVMEEPVFREALDNWESRSRGHVFSKPDSRGNVVMVRGSYEGKYKRDELIVKACHFGGCHVFNFSADPVHFVELFNPNPEARYSVSDREGEKEARKMSLLQMMYEDALAEVLGHIHAPQPRTP